MKKKLKTETAHGSWLYNYIISFFTFFSLFNREACCRERETGKKRARAYLKKSTTTTTTTTIKTTKTTTKDLSLMSFFNWTNHDFALYYRFLFLPVLIFDTVTLIVTDEIQSYTVNHFLFFALFFLEKYPRAWSSLMETFTVRFWIIITSIPKIPTWRKNTHAPQLGAQNNPVTYSSARVSDLCGIFRCLSVFFSNLNRTVFFNS